uniref:Uncharacterized protein n=1 Tax=Fagus sylvatica TaxID=28930 RepID=A0A2N9IXJ0_FAGSY
MFGGLVTAPSNSPHLRKSGSRPVVFDLVTGEVENGVEEDFLHSMEANDLKSVIPPMSTAAIMPYYYSLSGVSVVARLDGIPL